MKQGKRAALPPGPLSARALGLLASLGIARLRVRRNPRVTVLVTGNELVLPGVEPGGSGVFESNGVMLKAALREMGIPARVEWVKDRPDPLTRAVKKALRECDLLLTTGGVSVGERDWMKEAFQRAGVRKAFWRVAQKPGGPLYFGRKGVRAVFGLPGNPAAVYSCFRLYVRPLLERSLGIPGTAPVLARLRQEVRPLARKTFFVKAQWEGRNGHRGVRILSGQGSHLLGTLATGDGLLEVPPGRRVLGKSTSLLFHPFAPGSSGNG